MAKEEQGGLVGGGSNVGFYVVTPFHLVESDRVILVNRGWVSKSKLDPKSRPQGQVNGQIDLVGVVRKEEKRQQFTPKNNSESNKWFIR